MMKFLVGIGEYLYDSVIVSKKSTLIAIAISLGIEAVNYTTTVLQGMPQNWAHVLAGLVTFIGMLLRSKQAVSLRMQKRAMKAAAAGVVVAFLLAFGLPTYAADSAPGPLAVQVAPSWSLHLNVQVPAIAYSLTEKQFKGQLTFGLNYVLDYKELVAFGLGGGYIQTNDAPGMLITGMVGGPVLGKFGEMSVFRPAALYEYRWSGAVHESLLAFTFALQF